VDGKPLGERKTWLDDDYVKFIRFAQWKIDQAGEGVLGFITNHSYLDNPTFRGMRQSVMTSFDQLHILNLHGSALKKEKSPDGSKDENVFDIMQGVAIVLAVKRKGVPKGIWYSDLWGDRDAKYRMLGNEQMAETTWQELKPRGDMYLFVPQDTTLAAEYEQWPKVTEIFPVSGAGVLTVRDHLAIHNTRAEVWRTVQRLASLGTEEARNEFKLGKDSRDWKVQRAQDDVRQSGPTEDLIAPILYRPFDVRFTYYTGHSCGFVCWPRTEVMQHLLGGQTLALVVCRQTVSETWQHALVASSLTDDSLVSNKTRERSYALPLYVHSSDGHSTVLFGQQSDRPTLKANFSPAIIEMIHDYYGEETDPAALFAYIYAILYSPAYRNRYASFLRHDFPRIPFTKDRDTFLKLAILGQQLIDLHLMRSPELDNPISRFCGKGDGAVTKVEYDADHGRVNINPTQYFDGVTPDLWSYQIGGYQVLSKWLDYRKDRFLTSADTIHYSRIVTALSGTMALQTEIDKVVLTSEVFGSA
jgi:predicted helicase